MNKSYVSGFGKSYLIYENGTVYSNKSNKFLKPDIARGYKQVTLFKNSIPYRFKVHRLVAIAFIKKSSGKRLYKSY